MQVAGKYCARWVAASHLCLAMPVSDLIRVLCKRRYIAGLPFLAIVALRTAVNFVNSCVSMCCTDGDRGHHGLQHLAQRLPTHAWWSLARYV